MPKSEIEKFINMISKLQGEIGKLTVNFSGSQSSLAMLPSSLTKTLNF